MLPSGEPATTVKVWDSLTYFDAPEGCVVKFTGITVTVSTPSPEVLDAPASAVLPSTQRNRAPVSASPSTAVV